MNSSDSSHDTYAPEKRQRVAARHDDGAFSCTQLHPRGFGVRLSPAVLISLFCFALFRSAIAADTSPATAARTNDTFPVLIQVDASQTKGELHPIWRFFGADEPNYATMKNGKKLIAELGLLGAAQSKPVYFRAHNL